MGEAFHKNHIHFTSENFLDDFAFNDTARIGSTLYSSYLRSFHKNMLFLNVMAKNKVQQNFAFDLLWAEDNRPIHLQGLLTHAP